MKSKDMPKKKSNRSSYIIGIIVLVIVIIGVVAVLRQPGATSPSTNPTATPPSGATTGTKVLFQTSAGNITIQLYTDKPITTANFINIVQKGWYDGTIFHRVIAGFMIQGGQISQTVPAIQDEIGTNNRNLPYTIAMAKTSQPNSATNEFFINVADNGVNNPGFDSTYTVFGNVTSGRDVVDATANAQVTANPNMGGEVSSPVHPITIIKATIVS